MARSVALRVQQVGLKVQALRSGFPSSLISETRALLTHV